MSGSINEDDNDAPVARNRKTKSVGIKHPSFTRSGKNGESHRANAKKKHAKSLANRNFRADLNARRGSMGATEYHAAQYAVSHGGAT